MCALTRPVHRDTLAALAADFVVMRVGATVMIHAPSGADDEKRAAWLEHMLDVYSSSTGLDDMTCRERFNGGDMRLDASEALARHFVDDIGDRYHARPGTGARQEQRVKALPSES